MVFEAGVNVEELFRSASLKFDFCGLVDNGGLAVVNVPDNESLLLGGAGACLRGKESNRFLNCSESPLLLGSPWKLYRLSFLTTTSGSLLFLALLPLLGGGGATRFARGESGTRLFIFGLECGDFAGCERVFIGADVS